MGVSIIRGAISSGKSDMCLKQISEIHEKNPDSKCIMIVPDHYSYETERKFVDFFGGIGLNNIEVLTLRRMSINFLSAKQQNHLTASGKMMLIYGCFGGVRRAFKRKGYGYKTYHLYASAGFS